MKFFVYFENARACLLYRVFSVQHVKLSWWIIIHFSVSFYVFTHCESRLDAVNLNCLYVKYIQVCFIENMKYWRVYTLKSILWGRGTRFWNRPPIFLLRFVGQFNVQSHSCDFPTWSLHFRSLLLDHFARSRIPHSFRIFSLFCGRKVCFIHTKKAFRIIHASHRFCRCISACSFKRLPSDKLLWWFGLAFFSNVSSETNLDFQVLKVYQLLFPHWSLALSLFVIQYSDVW